MGLRVIEKDQHQYVDIYGVILCRCVFVVQVYPVCFVVVILSYLNIAFKLLISTVIF